MRTQYDLFIIIIWSNTIQIFFSSRDDSGVIRSGVADSFQAQEGTWCYVTGRKMIQVSRSADYLNVPTTELKAEELLLRMHIRDILSWLGVAYLLEARKDQSQDKQTILQRPLLENCSLYLFDRQWITSLSRPQKLPLRRQTSQLVVVHLHLRKKLKSSRRLYLSGID